MQRRGPVVEGVVVDVGAVLDQGLEASAKKITSIVGLGKVKTKESIDKITPIREKSFYVF